MDINITLTAKDIADIIAKMVQEKTSLRCEAYADDYGKDVIISNYTHLIARITPYYKSIQVVAAPLDLEAVATSIPAKVTSISGMRELTTHFDEAVSHVTAAALVAQRD